MKHFAMTTLAALSLAGCAAPVLKLPSDSPVTVTVLSDARQSDLGFGDYLIPGSQVYVGGRTIGTNVGGSIGGLAPFSIGAAVDAALNAADVGDAGAGLAMKFNPIVVEALRTEPAGTMARGPRLRVVRANDRDAAIELEPLARFWMPAKPNANLVFHLNANFDVPGVRGRLNQITYAHGAGGARPLMDEKKQGWADQGGASIRTAAQRAFVRMTDVFKADLRGDLKRDAANLKRVRWESPNTNALYSGLLLYEQPDYVAVIPLLGEREPQRNATLIIDRSQLRAD